ncbi:MAG: hypothetical protein KJZ92_17165 [Rhodocyclaceae bacterium]|nr:hypothetical protein [Rhodocyclaceae bacterium]
MNHWYSLSDAKPRVLSGVASAVAAAVFLGLFASAPLAFGSIGYWLFIVGVFCLAFALHGRVD